MPRTTLRASLALAAALLALAAPSRVLAQGDDPAQPADGIYLELLDGPPLATLADADAAVRAGEHERAAVAYQALVDLGCGAGRDKLVLVREAPRGADALAAVDPRPVETTYASLPVALRARLAALPPAGLKAYRSLVDARAGALATQAIAARDRVKLEEIIRRYLFSTRGAEAAIALGDVALEGGDLLVAAWAYESAALVPDAPRALAERRKGARARLAEEDRRAAAASLGGVRPPPSHTVLVEGFDGEASFDASVDCPPIPLADGLAVARPGHVVLLRSLADGAAEPAVRPLPPEPLPVFSPRPGPLTLGGASARGLLAVTIEHARGLVGSDADDAHAASTAPRSDGKGPKSSDHTPGGAPTPSGAESAPGASGGPSAPTGPETGAPPASPAGPGGAPGAPAPANPIRPARASAQDAPRGGVFGDAFDLFVFDLRRGDKLLFTTAEAAAFGGANAEWLAGVEWTARPILGPGLIFGAAAGRTGEPEVHVAAFDPGARGPGGGTRPALRWRTFLCARGFLGGGGEGEEVSGPPVEPALALAGRHLIVDTGVGLLAALDAASGDVAWAVRRALPQPSREQQEMRTVIRGFGDSIVLAPARATDAPIVVAPSAKRPDGLAVVAARAPGPPCVVALDVASGETVWTLAAEGAAYPVAALGDGRIAVVESGRLTLVDGASGRRLGRPLVLPAHDAEERAASAAVGRGAGLAGRILVAVGDHVLVVRVEEDPASGPRLRCERAIASGRPAGHASPAALAGGVAFADGSGLSLCGLDRPGGPSGTAAWEDAIGVAEAYDAICPPEVPALLREIARGAASGQEVLAAGLEVDASHGLFRVWLPPPIAPAPLRVALVLDRASGALSVEVAENAAARKKPAPGRPAKAEDEDWDMDED